MVCYIPENSLAIIVLRAGQTFKVDMMSSSALYARLYATLARKLILAIYYSFTTPKPDILIIFISIKKKSVK